MCYTPVCLPGRVTLSTMASGSRDGIQVDGCFYTHGAYHQTGTYGAEFVSDVMLFVVTAAGTGFDMTPAAEAALSLLLLDGQRWVCSRVWVLGPSCAARPHNLLTAPCAQPPNTHNLHCWRHDLVHMMTWTPPTHSSHTTHSSSPLPPSPPRSASVPPCRYMMRSGVDSRGVVSTGWDWSSKGRSITRSYDKFDFGFWAEVRPPLLRLPAG